MNIRIGISINGFKNLSNWQLRIIQAILNDSTLELVVVSIHDTKENLGLIDNSSGRIFSKISLGRLLLKLQGFIEKKVFFKEVYCVDKEGLIGALNQLPKIDVRRRSKMQAVLGDSDIVEKIKQYDPDVILNLGICQLPDTMQKVPKYGVWDFLYMDSALKEQKPTGFAEVLQKKPAIGFTLLKQTINKQQAEILDSAFFNRGWSMVETATIVQEGSVSVLLKNLRKLHGNHKFDSNSYDLPNYKPPRLYDVLVYMIGFYKDLSRKIWQRAAYRIWGQRHECWSIFIGKGRFLENSTTDVNPLEMPKDEFWADPFLFRHQGTNYVFFENFSYKKNRGKISCGIVQDNELVDIVDVLDLEYHLSFPFIFEEDGNIFLMPETCENKRLEIYRAIDFPTKWELYTTAFEGEMVADAFFFDDEQNQKWLFVNKQAAETSPMNSELFIYKADSVKLENLESHSQNPVITDARVARNGGAIFADADEIYRPSQRNVDGIYGRALNINVVKKLTIDEYIEENIQIFEPDFDKNLIAAHHLSQANGLYVFDAAYKTK